MAKKKNQFRTLNDYNEIVAYLQERQAKERNIIIAILGATLGIALVIVYVLVKG
jgi:hypothetical protein